MEHEHIFGFNFKLPNDLDIGESIVYFLSSNEFLDCDPLVSKVEIFNDWSICSKINPQFFIKL